MFLEEGGGVLYMDDSCFVSIVTVDDGFLLLIFFGMANYIQNNDEILDETTHREMEERADGRG